MKIATHRLVSQLLISAACFLAVFAQTPAPQPPAAAPAGEKAPPKPPPPPKVIDTGVATNPRSGKDDPRVRVFLVDDFQRLDQQFRAFFFHESATIADHRATFGRP